MLISKHVYYILLKIKDNIKENKEVRIIRNGKYKRKCMMNVRICEMRNDEI
jgi:hypothetical protein